MVVNVSFAASWMVSGSQQVLAFRLIVSLMLNAADFASTALAVGEDSRSTARLAPPAAAEKLWPTVMSNPVWFAAATFSVAALSNPGGAVAAASVNETRYNPAPTGSL